MIIADGGRGLPGAGDLVVAAGAGVTGLPVVRYLARIGASVLVTSNRPAPAGLAEIAGDVTFAGDLMSVPQGCSLVVTSAGIPPSHPLLASALAADIEVIGETELAWRIDQASGSPRPWLVVTGTNGKTTTIGLLEAMLQAAGRQVTACGNVGWPVIEAVLAGGPLEPWQQQPRQDLIAAELSSFQLHYAPSLRPRAGLLLNLAEDHLDWHGSMAAYAQAKALALTGDIAVAVRDRPVDHGSGRFRPRLRGENHPDPTAESLLRAAPAGIKVEVIDGVPADGQIGVTAAGGAETVVDQAFGHGRLFAAADLRLPGRHNVTNAMAAAALALAVDVPPPAIRQGVRAFTPGAHRNQPVAEIGGVRYVNDTKATNPHAAAASLLAYQRVVWIAGGQLKGATVDELVARIADRLAGVVLLGVDAQVIEDALGRHAPDVPRISVGRTDDGAMDEAVRAAATLAAPGTVVLLAPAAASLDMFSSYAARGDAFARAVAALDRP
ncbi:UDP-N-acetylmuramoyl-L-alanine--D-glutamate ligase [Nakamurella lactea]|uniref:UDP-N-acetylmuramoyl-L-alanine--D-glutamate ligase n=1 Tax=Nakamurella lactea TaxID=459515 RepID=UPI000404574E|nr:UDP-N-acetylmuramoyl-L-alanine--D-glutamate ligase [Nakamurella lactea]